MGAGKPGGAQAPVVTESITQTTPEASPPGGLLAKMLAEAEAAKKAKLESVTQASVTLPESLKGTPFGDALLKASAAKAAKEAQNLAFLKPQTKQVPTLDSLLAYQKQQQELATKAKAEAEAKAAAEQAKAAADAKAAQDAAIQAELAKNTFTTADLPGVISARNSYVPSVEEEEKEEEKSMPQSPSPFATNFEQLVAKAKAMQKTNLTSKATASPASFFPSLFGTTEKEQQQKGINMGPGYASMSEQFFVPGYKEKMEKLFGGKF